MKVLGEPFEVSFVEELDLHVRVALAQLAELAVLARDERLLHHRQLDVQILIREVEVGRERLGDPARLVLLEDERRRLVLPRHPVVVEDFGAFELRLAGETRWLLPPKYLENRCFEPHLEWTVLTASDGTPYKHGVTVAR